MALSRPLNSRFRVSSSRKDGKFYIVESVPARVDIETGEQFFAPKTVEQLHRIILEQRKPVRTMQAPVFEFA